MFVLRRFHSERFDRVNALLDEVAGHVSGYINLIGSATLPLAEVCAAQAAPGTAIRAEGFRGRRLFPASGVADSIDEAIADLVDGLFGLDGRYAVTGQPHSATQANQAAIRAFADPTKGPVLGLAPVDGGHVSHRVNAPSGEFVSIPLAHDGIDFAALRRVAAEVKPSMIIAGATSYTRSIDFEELAGLARDVGAHLHGDFAHTAPFVASGRHPPVFPACDSATIDTGKTLRGPRGGILIIRSDRARPALRALFPGTQTSPNQAAMLAKATCLAYWTSASLAEYCDRLVATARIIGDRLTPSLGQPVFGGTDSHLLLYDLRPLRIHGRTGEERLERVRILVNRNQIPGDAGSPWSPAGLRLSSTIPTILGYADEDVVALADAIGSVLTRDAHDPTGVVDDLLRRYHREVISISSESTSSS